MVKKINKEYSSFRDPSGYIYYDNGKIYRRINKCYFKEYDYFVSSGLYDELVSNNYIIKHREVYRCNDYITLEVDKVPFISYPYEWCFLELKDASLLTLKIQKIALKYNMTLKDASGYNIQFINGNPIFIDTLSFAFYEEGTPWGAYGQFCRHFMGPLLLMRYVNESLNTLLKSYIDGVPLDIVRDILKGRGGFTAYIHIIMHSKSISKNNNNINVKKYNVSKNSINNIILMLERQVIKLNRKNFLTEWDNYYDNTNYSDSADKYKQGMVSNYLKIIDMDKDSIIWDLGANDGKYSRIASKYSDNVISFDIDINAVNRNYLMVKENSEKSILPLILDLTNPSPSIGFGNLERKSISARGNAKCIMVLALIHHICISNNVPFNKASKWFSKLGEYLIIEFVDKSDSQVVRLLSTRNDIFRNYDINFFEKEFSKYFEIIKKNKIKDSNRVLYLMRSNCYGKG